ncbi:hypothetical protein, partial [Brevundimonas aurantiaca]
MISRLPMALLLALSVAPAALAEAPKPAAIVADGLPAVPDDLVAATQPYLQTRRATFLGWNAADQS